MQELFYVEDSNTPWSKWSVDRLFFAVLLTAYMDLDSSCRHTRGEALRWFQSDEDGMPDYISYRDVLNNVDISHRLMRKINDRLCSYSIAKKIA